MAQILSNYLVQQFQDYYFGQLIAAPVPPSNFYVRLWTTSPGPGNSGGVELTTVGTNYTPLQIPNNSGYWSASSGRNKQNSTSFSPWFTVGANTSPIVAVTMHDAPTSGNELCINEVAIGPLLAGNVITFNIGSCTITWN